MYRSGITTSLCVACDERDSLLVSPAGVWHIQGSEGQCGCGGHIRDFHFAHAGSQARRCADSSAVNGARVLYACRTAVFKLKWDATFCKCSFLKAFHRPSAIVQSITSGRSAIEQLHLAGLLLAELHPSAHDVAGLRLTKPGARAAASCGTAS